MRTTLLVTTLTLASVVSLRVPPRAHAQESTEAAARVHHAEGEALLAAGKYREARARFSAGYDLSKRPAFLFNMGECSRLAGDKAEAERSYQAYLSADPTGKLAGLARQRLAQLGVPRLAPTTVQPPPPVRREIRREPAAALDLNVRTDPTTPPSHPSSSSSTSSSTRPVWKKWPFWAVVTGTVVAGGATAYLVTSASSPDLDIDWR